MVPWRLATRPLWRGMPNLVLKSVRMWAMVCISWYEYRRFLAMFSYLPPMPSPFLIFALGRLGFRNSVVCRFLSCVSATSVLNMAKTK